MVTKRNSAATMMSSCAACNKPVYPTEKMNCLDKVWHKTCFRCQECGMVLTLKNHKGFQKKPYCSPHYPKLKYTQVAETPENKRLRDNSDAMSKAKYQAEFQKLKGKKLSVTDDAAGNQLKQVQELQSKAKYQKNYKENIVGSKTSVADDMHTKHLKLVQDQTSAAKYHKEFNEQIKGCMISSADDIKTEYLRGLQDKISSTKYQEEYKKNIVGTKLSTTDDIMSKHLKETQAKITGIGYRQNSLSSLPISISSNSSESPAPGVSDSDSGFEESKMNSLKDPGKLELHDDSMYSLYSVDEQTPLGHDISESGEVFQEEKTPVETIAQKDNVFMDKKDDVFMENGLSNDAIFDQTDDDSRNLRSTSLPEFGTYINMMDHTARRSDSNFIGMNEFSPIVRDENLKRQISTKNASINESEAADSFIPDVTNPKRRSHSIFSRLFLRCFQCSDQS